MSEFCSLFRQNVFPNSEERTQRQIARLDDTIEKINAEIQEKRKKMKEIKDNIKLLKDPNVRMDGQNSSRARMIDGFRKRIGLLMEHIKRMEDNLAFFEKSKFSLENNQMSSDLSRHIRQLREEMSQVNVIDIDKLEEDTTEIAEVTDYMEEHNNRVGVLMESGMTDVDIDDDEVDAYLNASDDDIVKTRDTAVTRPTEEQIMEREISVPDTLPKRENGAKRVTFNLQEKAEPAHTF